MAARYRKVAVRLWCDEKFSALDDRAKLVWLYMLTSPQTVALPGLLRAGPMGMAEELGMEPDDFLEAFAAIQRAGLRVEMDRKARVVWIPGAIRYNEPESPNAVAAWRRSLDEIPECALRDRAVAEVEAYLLELGPSWARAWEVADGREPRPTRVPHEVAVAVRTRDGSVCRYCDVEVNWHDRKSGIGATYDHVDPAGPSTTDNVVVSCRSCSSRKSMRRPIDAGMRDPFAGDHGSDQRRITDRITDPINNQEQEQEQEQEQNSFGSRAGARGDGDGQLEVFHVEPEEPSANGSTASIPSAPADAKSRRSRLKRRSRLWHIVPDDFVLSADDIRFALDHGFTDEEIRREETKWRNFEYRTPKSDASRCWRTWITNAVEYRRRDAGRLGRTGTGAAPLTAAEKTAEVIRRSHTEERHSALLDEFFPETAEAWARHNEALRLRREREREATEAPRLKEIA